MKSQRASKPESDPPPALLSPSNPADLQRKMRKVQLAIARRAYELFEARGREQGHDWEDWFRGVQRGMDTPKSVSGRFRLLDRRCAGFRSRRKTT